MLDFSGRRKEAENAELNGRMKEGENAVPQRQTKSSWRGWISAVG